ncbi:MAG TPA: hypothetical protein VGD84_01795 [Pseudonocardiaceae bacterium]|jgi:hypothetical protein
MTWARHVGEVTAAATSLRSRMAEQAHNDIQNARATMTVASHAVDAEDCGNLLAMLGLDAAERSRS